MWLKAFNLTWHQLSSPNNCTEIYDSVSSSMFLLLLETEKMSISKACPPLVQGNEFYIKQHISFVSHLQLICSVMWQQLWLWQEQWRFLTCNLICAGKCSREAVGQWTSSLSKQKVMLWKDLLTRFNLALQTRGFHVAGILPALHPFTCVKKLHLLWQPYLLLLYIFLMLFIILPHNGLLMFSFKLPLQIAVTSHTDLVSCTWHANPMFLRGDEITAVESWFVPKCDSG